MSKVTSRKVVKSARMVALDKLAESLAKDANKSVMAYKNFLILSAAARREKVAINVFINDFNAKYPNKTRGEFDSKLAEIDTAIKEAQNTPIVLKVLLAQRAEMVKRHDASKENARKAANARKSRKASEVITKLVSFDSDGMPIAI